MVNVIVLMLDSLRPDYLGCGGHSEVKTPYIDRVAKEGIFFENAYAEYPITIPSRTALVSGNHTFTNRPWCPLRSYDLHIAEILHKNGFVTAAFSDSPFNESAHMHRGFDTFEYVPEGKCHKALTEKRYDFKSCYYPPGTSDTEKHFYPNTMTNRFYALEKHGKACPELLFDKALDWLDGNHSQPFFLWIDSFEPHEPWCPPSPYDTLYTGAKHNRYIPFPVGPDATWMSEEDRRHLLALYMGDATHIDEMVGEVTKKLKELKLEGETLIVIISDHGEPFGEHGTLRKYGVPVYEELSRIIFIMKKPGIIPEGKHCMALVENIDFLPTILDMAGMPVPKREGASNFMGHGLSEEIDGRSLVPLFSSDKEVHNEIYMGGYGLRAAIRHGPWKFIDNRGEKSNELFNLQEDSQEKYNLIGKEKNLSKELHRKLWGFQARWSQPLSWRDEPVKLQLER